MKSIITCKDCKYGTDYELYGEHLGQKCALEKNLCTSDNFSCKDAEVENEK